MDVTQPKYKYPQEIGGGGESPPLIYWTFLIRVRNMSYLIQSIRSKQWNIVI